MAVYAIVPNIDAPELTWVDMNVWFALCLHTKWERKDDDFIKGVCFPGTAAITKAARVSRRSTFNSLNHLEELGYVERAQGNNKNTTTYILHPEDKRVVHQMHQCTRCTSAPDALVQEVHGGSAPGALGSAGGAPHILGVVTEPINSTIEQEEEGKAAAADEPNRVKLGQVIKLWNDRLGALGFPQVMKTTPARQRAFQARLNESQERQTVEWWEKLMAQIAGSEFLVNSAKQKAGWLNFDWVLNENNLVKVLEGRYDGKCQETRTRGRAREEYIPMTYEEAAAMYRGQGLFGAIDVEVTEDDTRTGLRAIC